MVNIGAGSTRVQNFLAALNIPSPQHKSMGVLEQQMGNKIVTVAQNSCEEALQTEQELTWEQSSITVSFDGGWSTRGSGL